jgi:phosphoglycerate dehydrogenase-like enzyme
MTEANPIVLITEPEYRKGEECFVEARGVQCRYAPAAEEELAGVIRDAQAKYVIVGPHPYTGPLYDALPAGGVIARFGVGHDGIDKPRATARRLLCTNTPGVLDQSVAEYTMLLIAAAAKRLPSAMQTMGSGGWYMPAGRELQGRTLAVIGCGGIGRAVARIATVGYGMLVVGCTKLGAPPPDAIDHMHRVTNDFADAVRDADFVSLHIPSRPSTHRFINRERLAYFSERAWLINTSRGAVVDEAALFDVLASGRIAGSALDVFAREPYVPEEDGGDLRTLANVIATPHIGSATVEANRRMAERALRNIRFALLGERDRMDLLNRDV